MLPKVARNNIYILFLEKERIGMSEEEKGDSQNLKIRKLTPREKEVLCLVALGKNNKEIAEELVISKHTAKAHVGNIMDKFNIHDRTLVAVTAVREGLI